MASYLQCEREWACATRPAPACNVSLPLMDEYFPSLTQIEQLRSTGVQSAMLALSKDVGSAFCAASPAVRPITDAGKTVGKLYYYWADSM